MLQCTYVRAVMSLPRIALVPHTSKVPEACAFCGSHVLTRRGTRKKKLEIVQLWRCAPCKRVFTEVTDQTAILVKLSPPDAATAAAGAPASNRGRSGAPRGLSGPW